jgi:hypothetical protein
MNKAGMIDGWMTDTQTKNIIIKSEI